MNELALFAGGGGGILGGLLLGWRTRCAVEINAYGRAILLARQRDGALPLFPIWDDVRTFDGRLWRGSIDVISGGFPCQDISAAGKGAGITGARSGLWVEFARIIREVEPRHVFVENSPMLVSRGLGVVLGDLASMGFDARWGVLGAVDAGAPHQRDRIWIVATHPRRELLRQQPECECRGEREAIVWSDGLTRSLADSDGARQQQSSGHQSQGGRRTPHRCQSLVNSHGTEQQEQRGAVAGAEEYSAPRCAGWWATEPDVGRVAHGVAARVDRLSALGNGQVSAVAALAWRTLGGAP